jgi:hypothetical protein
MYTSKDIAEAIEKIPADDLDATAMPGVTCVIAGLSEEAVQQMMKGGLD